MPKTTRSIPLALVGGESLLGREVREVFKDSGLNHEFKVFSGGEGHTRTLTEDEGEAVVLEALGAEELSDAAVVLLAGTAASSKAALDLLKNKKTPLVDLTGALEDNPAARLRAPGLEPEGETPAPGAIHVVAHPAASAIALFLTRLHAAAPLRRSVILILEPVSERGKPGLDELHYQTIKLLSFQKLEKPVFDAQVSFNLLPEYGEDAPQTLASVEQRVERNLASLLAFQHTVPMPSLRLVQAPVFHGYSFSIWAEFEQAPNLEQIAEALKSHSIEVRTSGQEAPTNVGAAGQSGLSAGAISVDRNDPRAAWFWVVCDNLRVTAENALEVVRALVR